MRAVVVAVVAVACRMTGVMTSGQAQAADPSQAGATVIKDLAYAAPEPAGASATCSISTFPLRNWGTVIHFLERNLRADAKS
jgi:hypothetical protein